MTVPPEVLAEIKRLQARMRGPMRRDLRFDLREQIERSAGFQLSRGEWRLLAHCSSRAEGQFINSPPSAASKKRVEDLQTAAAAFRIAASAVLKDMTGVTLYPGHPKPEPAAWKLDGDILKEIEGANWLQDDYFEGSDFLKDALKSVEAIENAAKNRLRRIAPPLPGQKLGGYDLFLKVCNIIWSNHGDGRGYSRNGGKWKGPLVDFVFAAQCLLAEAMRRSSKDSVGAAIQSWVERGMPYEGG